MVNISIFSGANATITGDILIIPRTKTLERK